MKEISVKKGRRPVFFLIAGVLLYIFRGSSATLLYLSPGMIFLAIVLYWRSCRCPVCNAWLKIWDVMQEDTYTCPHCENELKVVK